ncbi:hypothetical protein ACP3WD_24280, partial [Salmonella enterica]|uniref:hypothetical protein n=1 Tax=Salmonella enterica TaxID=28901 RepID=UPI003CF67432
QELICRYKLQSRKTPRFAVAFFLVRGPGKGDGIVIVLRLVALGQEPFRDGGRRSAGLMLSI